MRAVFLGFSLIYCLLISCGSAEPEYKYLDLMSYGVPIEIQAPDSTEVTTSDMGVQKDLVLKGPDNYQLQIFYSDAFRNQKSALEQRRETIEENPYFKEFVREDPNGFIYAFEIDSTFTNYGFRYVKVKSGKELVIQPGMSRVSTLEDVEKLYGYAQNVR